MNNIIINIQISIMISVVKFQVLNEYIIEDHMAKLEEIGWTL